MDNRPGRRDREPARYVSEVGTDTVPVNLVELQSLGGGKRQGLGPAFLVALAAVATVSFALGSSMTTAPAATPTAPAAALASTTATTPGPSPSPSRRPPPTPTPPPATPTPAPTFEWTWTRSQRSDDLGRITDGIWGVDDRILLLGRTSRELEDGYDWRIGALREDLNWRVFTVPAAIEQLAGGTVVNGRLWFLARIGGVTEADANWQLVSTDNGEAWDSLGATKGLEPMDGAGFLGRVGDVWVTNPTAFEGGSLSRLRWSADGRTWQAAQVPATIGEIQYLTASSLDDRMLILARAATDFDDVETFVLTSADGSTWKRSSLGLPVGRSAFELSCNLGVCVVPVEAGEGDGTKRQVMVSTNGRDWSGVMLDLPMLEPDSTLRLVRPTPRGFIAMAGFSGFALTARDGRDWNPLQTMPADRIEWLSDLAVAGDLVLGYAEAQSSEVSDSLWQGSLSAMGVR